ncbi:MAG: ABC transporter ATP-binding protein [Paludibacteraceae bacterium]|nr:ABC transporter ATP-binding protein [Paludibacteraceae bacterium]
MIEISNITKSFGSLRVLKGVSLHVEKGEIVAIIGPSGAGKTTLLQIIGTLDKPDSGAIEINGKNLSKMSSDDLARFRNQEIGFIFQFHQLLPEFTALENVMLPALIAGTNINDARQQALSLLQQLGLHNRIDHKPAELSGGEKQRVAAARALINKPSVILADEPTGSLDSANKKELQNLLLELRDKFKQTIIIVTHDPELANIADRTIKMRDGMIEQ